jgi:hypothetical protein
VTTRGLHVRDAHGISIECLLELVDLSMAHVVIKVGSCRWRITTLANVSPALLVLLASVQRESSRQNYVQSVGNSTGKELDVDI